MADFQAGQILTATLLNDKFERDVVKLADESLVSNLTPQNDDELAITVAASTRYKVELYLVFNCPTAADLRLQWTTPAGVAGWWTATSQNLAAASETVYQGSLTWAQQAQVEGSASDKAILVRGVLVTAGTSGTLTLQWAQVVASGTTTVRANSVLTLRKIG